MTKKQSLSVGGLYVRANCLFVVVNETPPPRQKRVWVKHSTPFFLGAATNCNPYHHYAFITDSEEWV